MNIGVLGFAHGHVNAYCQRWVAEPDLDIRVAAAWDADEARLSGAVERFGPVACTSIDDLLAQDIEAVIIASETVYHAELVEKAARAGKAIILQKPLALTLEEADRIVSVIDETGVRFSMAWQMRVDPQNLEIKALIDSGKLGRIYQIRRRHCLDFCRDVKQAASWHLNPAYNRDIFADDASHAMDFLYWIFGMPVSVTAELGTLRHAEIANDHAISIFRYDDGMMAEVSDSFCSVGSENTTEITAEKGSLVQNYGDAVSAKSRSDDGSTCLKWILEDDEGWTLSDDPGVSHQGERIAALAKPLADFLHHRRPALATAEEGRDVLRMLLACYDSNERGQRIKL